MAGELKIFSGSANPDLARKISKLLSTPLSNASIFHFPEGNIYVRIRENVRRKEVFFIQSGVFPVNDLIMETLFFIDAFKRASASSITVILPFFPYTKGDKKDEPRVSIRAKVISQIIETAGADRIVTVDLQPPQIQGFFQIPVDNLYAMPVFCDYLKTLNLEDPVVVSPDYGAAKMADNFAHELNAPVVIGNKERHAQRDTIVIRDLIGDVKNKNAVIVDDMIVSGGTLSGVCQLLKMKGALKTYACISHALLSEEFLKKLESDELYLDKLLITDSLPVKKYDQHSKIEQLSIAQLLSEAISSIYNGDSLSKLFKRINLLEK